MILWLVEWDTIYSKSDNYEKKVETMMINNSTNINKTNNHISPQIMEQKKRARHMALKSRSWLKLRQAQTCGGVKPINWIPFLPLLLINRICYWPEKLQSPCGL